jgi:hypothetical protein
LVDAPHLVLVEIDVGRGRVLQRVLGPRGLGDGEEEGEAQQEGESDLVRRGAVGPGDLGQDPATLAAGDGKSPEPNGL